MSIVSPASPSVQSGLDRLAMWLGAEGYGYQPIGLILAYTATEGTPTGAPGLDACDEEHAEWAYCQGCEANPGPIRDTSKAWCDPGVYGPAGADATLAQLDWTLERLQAALADTEEMPAPISGGAPSQSFSEWLDSQGGIAWEEGRD